MKRLILAAALAALTVPAFAVEVGKPFEQTELDRTLPQVNIPAPAQRTLDNASATAKSPWANDWNFIAPAA
ncbi:MAG TPA: hypothetical protein VH600_10765 [Burkholderiales bacterium]|jgi:hypothetical protein